MYACERKKKKTEWRMDVIRRDGGRDGGREGGASLKQGKGFGYITRGDPLCYRNNNRAI